MQRRPKERQPGRDELCLQLLPQIFKNTHEYTQFHSSLTVTYQAWECKDNLYTVHKYT